MDTANEVGISIFSIINNGGALGIDNESIFSNQIMVFPNPVNNQLNFTFNDTILADIISIQILDINGRVIKNIKTIHPQLSVDLNNLNAGIYLVKVKTTKANYTSKIIKK